MQTFYITTCFVYKQKTWRDCASMDFRKYFLIAHPEYYITPVCLNECTIETIFSQLKEGSGSTLSAASYSSARAKLAYIIKSCLQTQSGRKLQGCSTIHFS